jgi:hypothetical protein
LISVARIVASLTGVSNPPSNAEAGDRAVLVVQNDIQQRAMNFRVAVVADKAHFAELIHEEADS